jgi:hypothetical protein
VLLRHAKRVRVAAAVRGHARLEHHHTAAYIDDADRVLIAVRVDTDHVVQADLQASVLTSSPSLGDNSGWPVWG